MALDILIGVALVLGVIILTHEWGHFIVARLCGVPSWRASGGVTPGGSVHSLKYVIVRHWLRSHARLVAFAAIIVGIVIYVITR